jgi:DNA-directed RNA polymerase specialized sigma24 family protein
MSYKVVQKEADLIQEFEGRIASLARRFSRDRDDLMQIGRMALLEASRAWEEKEKHAQFWTFAFPYVLGAMLRFVTRETAHRAKERCAVWAPSFPVQPDVALEAKECLFTLPKSEAVMLLDRLEGFSLEKLSETTGLARSSVLDKLNAMKVKLRKRA